MGRRCRRGSELDAIEARKRARLEGQLGPGLPASLSMADETQNNTKTCGGQEAPVLLIGDLPYLQLTVVSRYDGKGARANGWEGTDFSEDAGVESRLVKKG